MRQLDHTPQHVSPGNPKESSIPQSFFVTGEFWLSSAVQIDVDISSIRNKFHDGSRPSPKRHVEISRIHMKTHRLENPAESAVGTVNAKG